MGLPTLMPSQIRTRLSLLTSLAVLAAAGCGEEEDVSPNFEDRIPPGLELTAVDRVVTWGEKTRFTGKLTQGDDVLEGETVVLEADAYPFGRDFAEIAEAETDEKGRFEIAAQPDANAAYRVAAGELSETTSREVRVFVEPRTELRTEPAANGTRFETIFRHPDDRSIQGSTLFSYAAPAAEAATTGKLRFIQVNRVDQEKLGLSSASITLPLAPEEVRYSACYGYTPDSGLGAPNSRCTQSSVPAP